MPADHVRKISHAEAEIMVPIDIQGSYVMVPVDIQDAYIMVPVDIQGSYIQVPVDIQGQAIVVGVDTLYEENTISGEVDTSTETSPVTVLTPSSGKKIETRGAYLFTTSSAGEVQLRFPTSNKIVAKIYADHFKAVSLPKVKFDGDVDEALQLEWSSLSTGAKIFYIVVYKEV